MRRRGMRSIGMILLIAVGLVPLLADSPGSRGDSGAEDASEIEVTMQILSPAPGSTVGEEFTVDGVMYIHGQDAEDTSMDAYVDYEPDALTDLTITVTAFGAESTGTSRQIAVVTVESEVTETDVDDQGVRRGLWEVTLGADELKLYKVSYPNPVNLRFEFLGDYDGLAFSTRVLPLKIQKMPDTQ